MPVPEPERTGSFWHRYLKHGPIEYVIIALFLLVKYIWFSVLMSLVADYVSSEDDSVDAAGAEDADQNVQSTVR